jgi:hypothetical protein
MTLTRDLDVMTEFKKFGNEQNWLGYIREFPKLQDKNFGDWLYDAQWTYYGNVEGELRHGQGRVVYNDGDCYEGKWNNGFMEKGLYVKYRNSDSNWVFNGTFTERDCPEKGIFSDGHKQLYVTCDEKNSIHELQFWRVLKGLLDKQVADKEAKVNEQIMDERWKDARPMIQNFKEKWIQGNYQHYQQYETNIILSPVVIFLCSGDELIQFTYSDIEKRATEGNITKVSNIVTTIPHVPIKIDVWLWCQEHLKAQINDDKIQDVYYNTKERRIAELDVLSSQSKEYKIKLNKAMSQFSIVINLKFELHNAEVGNLNGKQTHIQSLLRQLTPL